MTSVNVLRNYMPRRMPNESPFDGRVGFWGTVSAAHPDVGRVDVVMDIGREVFGLPVASAAWVKDNADTGVISGERNLPPIGSFVFCLMPTRTIAGAFVLCSGLPFGDAFTSEFLASADDGDEMDEYAVTEMKREPSGWTSEKRRDNGDVLIVSPKGDLKLNICHDGGSEANDKIELEAFGVSLTITRNTDDGVKINIGGDEERSVSVAIEGDASVSATGEARISCDGDLTASVGGDANVEASGAMTIKANGKTLAEVISALCEDIAAITTVGSPASHTLSPSDIAAFQSWTAQNMESSFK